MATEKHLIYKEDLLETVLDHFGVDLAYLGEDLQFCQEAIGLAPTVDAVEVVRCKDCKHRKRPLFAGNGIYCEEQRRHFELDDFCSYGERRTDHV